MKQTALRKRGKRGTLNAKEDAKTKKLMIEIHGAVCADAHLGGCCEGVDVHHLKTKAAHPELRHELSNLVLLCRIHHGIRHS